MNKEKCGNIPSLGIVMEKLTDHAKNCLARSLRLAQKSNCVKIENIHLFYSIFLEKGSIGSIFIKDFGIKKDFFEYYFKKNGAAEKISGDNPINLEMFSEPFKKTFLRAYTIARNMNCNFVGTEHFTYALLESEDKDIKKITAKVNLKKTRRAPAKNIRAVISAFHLNGFAGESPLDSLFDFLPESPMHFNGLAAGQTAAKKAKAKSVVPFIDKFCADINQKTAEQKETFIGREKEMERMINILGRKNKNNPLLIGHPGVGKTALVFSLAEMINAKKVPPFLFGKKIMSLDVASLVAGTGFRGEFESRLKEIIREAAENKNIILFIDEIHNIVGAGNISGSLDLANIIKPALAQGDIKLIGATTFAEYKKSIEKDAALDRRFQPIQVKEPSLAETKKILLGIKKHYEDFHNVSISPAAIDLAAELSDRYIKNRFLPDKAIDVIDEAASQIRSQGKLSELEMKIREAEDERQKIKLEKERLIGEENYEKAIQLRDIEKKEEEKIIFLKNRQVQSEEKNRIAIAPKDIFKVVARFSGVAEEKLSQAKNEKIKNIAAILNKQIIGQDEAIQKIIGALWRSQSGIGNLERPLGSFLFMGPTGVGKTFTAKTLAREFFASGSFIRIDMSEFTERHSISALIGSPAGYIGYGEGGRLTEKIRRNPYSVVLFDEIEKAHPDITNILLQILEDGILTDAEGLEINFKNTIIILTTNLGMEDFTGAGRIGFEAEKNRNLTEKFQTIKKNALKELEKRMKPEIINRLDNVLVFNPLGEKEIKKIAGIEMENLRQKLQKQNINLSFSDSVLNFIAQKSFSPHYGARMIRKNIQEMLENPLAEMIVHDKVKKNKITVSVKSGKIELI